MGKKKLIDWIIKELQWIESEINDPSTNDTLKSILTGRKGALADLLIEISK